jgi:tetratricopeptide (TPR) repeat protein/peroxiredoxin
VREMKFFRSALTGGSKMNKMKRITWLVLILTFILGGSLYAGQIEGGPAAPFALFDVQGKKYDLATMKASPMTIVYFFNPLSQSSVEGLLSLDQIAKKYKKADLNVLAVTASQKDKAVTFAKSSKLSFPVLIDNAKVSEAYDAKNILPTVCVIGPGQKVIDVIQGGGKTTSVMLERLAERKLQQRQTELAEALSDTAIKKAPADAKALMTKGYAALKAGKTGEAEKIFTGLANGKGISVVYGKEGLAAVYARKGDPAKALKLAEEVEKIAPERTYASIIKADVLYAKNKKDEARKEYANAAGKKEGESFQKALAYNKLGRLYAGAKDYKGSRELYDKAVELDPYYVEAMANKGVTYEKEGDYDKALTSYKEGEAAIKGDAYTKILAARATEMVKLQKDAQRRELINKYVDDLVRQYREQKKSTAPKDDWTTPVTTIAFVDFEEKGALGERDGISTVLTTDLADKLNSSGRVKAVDRVVMDRLLEELKIGSSGLADPETQLKLGKILAARVLGTGVVFNLPDVSLLRMRLIDTETTGIKKVINRDIGTDERFEDNVNSLNRELLAALIKEYPVKGYVVSNKDGNLMINVGSNQGVVKGTKFNVIEEQPATEYKGKVLKASPKIVGEIEVVSTELDFSNAKIIKQDRPVSQDDKIIEKSDAETKEK